MNSRNLTRTDLRKLYPDFMLLLSQKTEAALSRPPHDRSTDSTHELVAIRAAIGRIRQGSYGLCEECEEVIPVERLTSNPTARLCLTCQRELETKTVLRRRAG